MANILTGLRANSGLHLGNYFGGILPMVRLQKNLKSGDKLFMFVPDLHSFTTPIDHSELHQNSLNNLKVYLASGMSLENASTVFYRQSRVPAHSELTWILSCFSYFGEMQKMTQFKDKKSDLENESQPVSVGLFTYPILMAADILLYGAEWVPVGEDQQQHLELARNLAIRFNNRFAEGRPIFTVPRPTAEQLEFLQLDKGLRIRNLQNPAKKMSKSDYDSKGTIYLTDQPKDAAKKIMSAATDSVGCINWNWTEQPGVSNLLQILALLEQKSVAEVQQTWQGQTQYGPLKKAIAEKVEVFLDEFQTKLSTVTDEMVTQTLVSGEKEANILAKETLFSVQKAVGLR